MLRSALFSRNFWHALDVLHHSQALVAGRRNSMHWSPLEKFKGIHWKNFPSKTLGKLWFQAAPWNRYFDQTMVVQKFGTWRHSYRSVSKFNSRPAKLVIKRNEHLHIKHCKNEVVFRRIWKGPKNGRKQKTLRKHRESELATVGKTGGVLSAAFQLQTPQKPGLEMALWPDRTRVRWIATRWINQQVHIWCHRCVAVPLRSRLGTALPKSPSLDGSGFWWFWHQAIDIHRCYRFPLFCHRFNVFRV